jgi:hypothetical protein
MAGGSAASRFAATQLATPATPAPCLEYVPGSRPSVHTEADTPVDTVGMPGSDRAPLEGFEIERRQTGADSPIRPFRLFSPGADHHGNPAEPRPAPSDDEADGTPAGRRSSDGDPTQPSPAF